ncbi:hypothetical protein, partial [Polaromonas sp. DSR2-3-2]|uniref:hypothetical protein n=1 Tax=Polaromonas sp. DSR2-3-2 TaxID=2804622 RepID=UPI003CEC18B2
SYTPRPVSFMRNTVPTVSTAVPTVVTIAIGHVRRNQRSRCRNPPGHVHRNVGHDPGITGHVGPEYSGGGADARALWRTRRLELIGFNQKTNFSASNKPFAHSSPLQAAIN